MDFKYFFMLDTAGKRHIIVARDELQTVWSQTCWTIPTAVGHF